MVLGLVVAAFLGCCDPSVAKAQEGATTQERLAEEPGSQETAAQESSASTEVPGSESDPETSVEAPNPSQDSQVEDSTSQTSLAWNLSVGQVFLVSASHMVKETVPIGGQSVELPMTLSLEAEWTVTEVDESGVATIEPLITRLKFEAKSPFLGEIVADTQVAPSATGMTDLEQSLRAAIGSRWKFRLAPNGQISDVQLPSPPPARADDWAASLLAPAQLQWIMTPLLIFSNQTHRAGESWTIPRALQVPVADQAPVGLVYSYLGPADAPGQTLEKFELRGETPAELAASSEASDEPGSSTSFALRDTKVSGFAFFDASAGYVTSITLRSTLSVAAEVEGMVTDSKVSVDSTITIKPKAE